MGDWWARLQEEAAKHLTPENINLAAQVVRDGVHHAVEQANQHVTAENIRRGAEIVHKGVNHAVEQVNQHVTPENIQRGAEIVRNSYNHAVEQVNQHVTPENIQRGAEIVRNGIGMAVNQAHQHINQENINRGTQMAGEGFNAAAQHIREHVTQENIQRAAEKMGKNFQEAAQGPVGQKVATAVKQNKVPLAVTAASIFVAAVPGIVTGPIMGVAHLLGFTSSGVAAGSVASGVQAGIGNVVAGSGFAVVQSAAAGGYGMAIITGIVQTAVGGVVGILARAVG